MEILVTGAGGFIGSHTARFIAEQPGMTVRGATRDGRSLGPAIKPCRLDVRDEASFAAALHGVDAVIQCAVGDQATTIDGSRILLRCARDGGVGRVVHLSSVSIYGSATGAVPETTALVSAEGHGYAHWKAAAEAACQEAGDLTVMILRPAIVYGPGSQLWITTPARRVLSGAWGGLGAAGQGTCNPVHVKDVAAACLAAVTAPMPPGAAAFNISGTETLSWTAWYADLAKALGRMPLRDLSPAAWRRRVLAGLPLKAMARVLPAAGRMFERQILLSPARSEMELFALAATYPIQKAAIALDWTPKTTLAAGRAEAVAWFRSMEPAS